LKKVQVAIRIEIIRRMGEACPQIGLCSPSREGSFNAQEQPGNAQGADGTRLRCDPDSIKDIAGTSKAGSE